ncbi:MAG TPA: PTS lactose/cellobiose transporter subunit IIA [Clostridiaceae bacterium]|nr:PTS lactose/cellobiose transporter subunit IIA [Clostridiaceae bacterium]
MNDNDKIIKVAMDIIIKAGDARLYITKALEAICLQDFVSADDNLKTAQEKIVSAHDIQTDIIQGAANGVEEYEKYNILFAHAQDTLMTITSELNIAKEIVNIYRSYEKRIRALEEKMLK